MEGNGSHMNVSYNCPIFHTRYTVDLKRFTNVMSIGQYFRLFHSTLQRFKFIVYHNVQNTNTCTLCSTLYYSNVLISINYIKIHWYSDMFRSQKTIFREYDCTLLKSLNYLKDFKNFLNLKH